MQVLCQRINEAWMHPGRITKRWKTENLNEHFSFVNMVPGTNWGNDDLRYHAYTSEESGNLSATSTKAAPLICMPRSSSTCVCNLPGAILLLILGRIECLKLLRQSQVQCFRKTKQTEHTHTYTHIHTHTHIAVQPNAMSMSPKSLDIDLYIQRHRYQTHRSVPLLL